MNKQERTYFYNGKSKFYDRTEKMKNTLDIKDTILSKTLTMFNYENLPDSLPFFEIEKTLQLRGYGFITEINGELTVLNGELVGDKVDNYNNPLEINCYIPSIHDYKIYKLSEGVFIFNDYLKLGLDYIINKYAYLINESELTMTIFNKWQRTGNIFIANNDSTAESIRTYLNKLENGEDSFIVSSLLYDSLKIENEKGNPIKVADLVEYDNYLRSLLYSQIGLNLNNVMKKERLITSEIENKDSIYPLVDNMKECRLLFIDELNKKYGLNVTVDFSSSWLKHDEKEEPEELEEDTEETEEKEEPEETEKEKEKE